MTVIDICVWGTPVPQGSMVRRGLSIVHCNDEELRIWRNKVEVDLIEAEPLGWCRDDPVELMAQFYFQRPKSHYGKRGLLKSSPEQKVTAPDLDKLTRAVGDAIQSSGIIRNDSQIIALDCTKNYCYEGQRPCLKLRLVSARGLDTQAERCV